MNKEENLEHRSMKQVTNWCTINKVTKQDYTPHEEGLNHEEEQSK